MFQTIKPNKEYWSKKIPFFKYGRPNPLHVFSDNQEKFSEAMDAFKFKQVFKNTGAHRHNETQAFLKEWVDKVSILPVILDIGASDGSTSLRLIRLINNTFKKYYVTDYNISCSYFSKNGYTYFFNEQEECFLVASERFVFYPSSKWLFKFLFGKEISQIKSGNREQLWLINQDLQRRNEKDRRITIMQYNIFQPWVLDKADIIIVGNLLHRVYFKDDEILKALRSCYEAMTETGIIVFIRNFPSEEGGEIEKSGTYKKNVVTKKFEKIHEVNGGIDIDDLILSFQCAGETDRVMNAAVQMENKEE